MAWPKGKKRGGKTPKGTDPSAPVEEKAEPKPSKAGVFLTSDELKDLIAATLKEVLPLTMGLTTQMIMEAQSKGAQTRYDIRERDVAASRETCSECGQKMSACKGKHRKAIVWPQREENFKYWQGLRINGKTYTSPAPGIAISIPEDLAIEHAIQEWERAEFEMMHPRTGFTQSGVLSPIEGKSYFIPANGKGLWAKGGLGGANA